jgi:hypothetical protein
MIEREMIEEVVIVIVTADLLTMITTPVLLVEDAATVVIAIVTVIVVLWAGMEEADLAQEKDPLIAVGVEEDTNPEIAEVLHQVTVGVGLQEEADRENPDPLLPTVGMTAEAVDKQQGGTGWDGQCRRTISYCHPIAISLCRHQLVLIPVAGFSCHLFL